VLLFAISFVAGILTVLAPCVLPLLPVIVGGSLTTGSKARAYTICFSLGASIFFFTLLLKVSSALIAVPQSFWQLSSGAILVLFGLALLFPRLWDSLRFVRKLNIGSNRALAVGYRQNSFWGDTLMGAALGPVFASCSPTYFIILATVLPASFGEGLADLIAYVVGLSGFLLIIALAGQRLVDRLNVTIEPGGWFRRSIGMLFVVVGIAVGTGSMARAEAWLLDHGFDVTAIEQRLLGSNTSASETQSAVLNMPQETGASSTAASEAFLAPAQKASRYKKAPELTGLHGYINTPQSAGQAAPITIGEFKGAKVVLIDIWTYSCINCKRTLPYVKAWYDKYANKGLEIIGVHTPEFAFEKALKNVEEAIRDEGIRYPVVLDNDYATWNAFGNQYWPRKYLIDIDGYIVYDHAGEGSYDETEAAIQQALRERAARLHLSFDTQMPLSKPEGTTEADFQQIGSPETYFGASRNEFLGNGVKHATGPQSFEEPLSVARNTLYLIGPWDIAQEYAQTGAAVGGSAGSARIDYRYYAKNVYFVAGSDAKEIEVEVLRDSKPLEAQSAGADVYFRDGRSYVRIGANKLYHLIGESGYGDHFLELVIPQPGLQAYTFTFG
jgi:cytochrome c biogenesis protein CcdA/thiol-disulfide isomerase/thioredoxin